VRASPIEARHARRDVTQAATIDSAHVLAQIATQTIYAAALYAALVFALERTVRAALRLTRALPGERGTRANEVVWSGLPLIFLFVLLCLSPPLLDG
jgi:hypothetical protein